MIVKQLIEKLCLMNPDAEVWIDTGEQLDICDSIDYAANFFEAEGLPKNGVDVVLSYGD